MIYFPKSDKPELQEILDEAKLADKESAYREGAVFEQLENDFYNKCYICEDNEVTSINVEHFDPHRGTSPDKKYDWNNLFYSCAHCNGIKHDKFSPLLNCTTESDKVWESLELQLIPGFKPKLEITVYSSPEKKQKCENTKALLEKSLNGIGATKMKQAEARSIRKKMLRVFTDMQRAIVQGDKDRIRTLTSISSPFAGMLRWVLKKEQPALYTELLG